MNREEKEIFRKQMAEAAAHRRNYDGYDPLDHNHDGVVTIEDGDTYFSHEGNDSIEETGSYADPCEEDIHDYEEEYCPDHGRIARERDEGEKENEEKKEKKPRKAIREGWNRER